MLRCAVVLPGLALVEGDDMSHIGKVYCVVCMVCFACGLFCESLGWVRLVITCIGCLLMGGVTSEYLDWARKRREGG